MCQIIDMTETLKTLQTLQWYTIKRCYGLLLLNFVFSSVLLQSFATLLRLASLDPCHGQTYNTYIDTYRGTQNGKV